MEQEKINQIKRLIHLENKISKIRSKYPELNGLDKEKTLMFFSKKIVIEEQEYLTLSDWEYFNVACIIPFEEIEQQLNKYDTSTPKMDEVKFIEDLQNYYNVSKNIIINRIKNVRKINKVKKMDALFDDEFKVKKIVKKKN